jgi:hypothetical protein
MELVLVEAPSGMLSTSHLLLEVDHGYAETLLLLADVMDSASEGTHHLFQTVEPFDKVVHRSMHFLS